MSNIIYQKRYNDIVNHYIHNQPDSGIYTEKHHIVPRCIGGDDSENNIVIVPAKAHYILHRLLTKIYPDNYKILYAFWCMSRRKNESEREYINSNRYHLMKESLRKAHKLRPPHRWTKELKKKMSEQRKGVPKSEKAKKNIIPAAMKNLEKANEVNRKRALSGEYFSIETRKKLSKINKGKVFSEQTKQKMSESAKRSNHGQKNVSKAYRKVTCVSCKTEMIYSNFMRWHYNKCKN